MTMLRFSARGAISRIDGGLQNQNLQLSVKHLWGRKTTTLVAARGFIAPAYELSKKVNDICSLAE